MTDPTTAMQSFQVALLNGSIKIQPGMLDPKLYVHFDNPEGKPRITYVRLEGNTVTAFAEFVEWERINGSRCWNIGYATPEEYRRQGRAKEIVIAAISNLREASARLGVKAFYVEAIISIENKLSQRVAEQTISDTPFSITDQVSGMPALRYVRRIE
jgi:hypothetical protein